MWIHPLTCSYSIATTVFWRWRSHSPWRSPRPAIGRLEQLSHCQFKVLPSAALLPGDQMALCSPEEMKRRFLILRGFGTGAEMVSSNLETQKLPSNPHSVAHHPPPIRKKTVQLTTGEALPPPPPPLPPDPRETCTPLRPALCSGADPGPHRSRGNHSAFQ